jgi:hypothetical protein
MHACSLAYHHDLVLLNAKTVSFGFIILITCQRGNSEVEVSLTLA